MTVTFDRDPEDYKPYLVYHRDRYDEDERHVVRVPSAMGPYDAKNQSLIEPEHWGCSAVREEEAS